MATATAIKGRKGGSSSARTPTEQPDDLQSVAKAKILIALGEGEFAGGLTAKQIYFDGTRVENDDGTRNFSGFSWDFRPGNQAQGYIQGIPGTENEIAIGTSLSSSSPWLRTFTNTQLSAVRLRLKWSALFRQQDNGDLTGNTVNYAIDLQTDGGTWNTVINTAVSGKTTTGYERSHRIDLPQAGTSWSVRVRKITPDANSVKVGDAMSIVSFTEVIDAKLRYPNTALLYVEFDSRQFNGNIPQITCEPKGRMVRVPDNYDPVNRSYSGTWQGGFKWAWTDNPAWIFYDIVVSERFGLGDRLTAANIDKWNLYQIAQYCDAPVPDGKGGSGTEPRYRCNVYVQSRNDAYTVLRDFSATFRGMTYWGGDQIVSIADMPRDVDYAFTNANVENGEFNYQSSTSKTRYTSALVSYSDPANGYADAMEPVFEKELVSRYKVYNQLEVTAIGCTRQSEANRKGRWGILTSNKDRVVTFSTGLEGDIPQPGHIIAIADRDLSGREMGGRISSVNGRSLTMDRAPTAVPGNRLMVNLPSGAAQFRTIQSVSGSVITVTTAYSETPQAESVWMVESDELYAQQYRVTSVSENEGKYTITAAAHDPDKFARIDTGAVIDERSVSVIPPGTQTAPQNILIDSYSVVNQGISVETMRVQWESVANAISYEAQWRRNDGNWINVPRSSTTSFEVPGIYSGRYLVRVRAINAAEISSGWGVSKEKTLTGKVGNPPKPTGFTVKGINWGMVLSWGFPANTADTLKTEIQYTDKADQSEPLLLSDVPYPQATYTQLGLKAGQVFWYRAQLVDKTGNESGYTDWIRGMVNDQADDYLGDVAKDFFQSPDGKALLKPLITDPKALAESILAQYDDVQQQWSNYGESRAGIIEARKLATDAQSSVAQLETNVVAGFKDANKAISETQANVQEKFTAYADINNPNAIWTLKTGIRYNGVNYDAGLSVATTVVNGAVETRVAVNANQFVIMSGQGDSRYSPFAVVGGQVFMNSTFIQDGTITNAKIGDYIQSNNWGSTGASWRLDKGGGLQFRTGGGSSGGSVYDGNGMAVFDTNGVERFRAGKLN